MATSLRSPVEDRARQARLVAAVIAQLRSDWRHIDFRDLDGSWPQVAARQLQILTAGQRASATLGAGSVGRMLREQNADDDPAGEINPEAFSGYASDGRALDTLLYQPVIFTKTAIARGADQATALASGSASLDRIGLTQMWDAYRGAVGAGITVRHDVGYVRTLTPPSCARCAILAGVWYRWRADFERHRYCDCSQIPAAEKAAGDLRSDPMKAFRAGQIHGLSKAETAALNEGADISQIVNAHRGMSTTTLGGRKVQFTREGVTKRGFAGQRLRASGRGRVVRLTPGQIYRDATSREDAIRLLRRHGYII